MKSIITISALLLLTYFDANAQCISCNNPDPFGTNNFSSKIGSNNEANGDNSFAGGYFSKATGKNSFAFGELSFAGANYAVALGTKDTANWVGSIAIGTNARSGGTGSIALGNQIQALGHYLIVIGTGFQPQKKLRNPYTNSLMIGFNSMKPTFFVSSSLAYNKTGRIGIGNVTAPRAKLHLRADADEAAVIFIEPNSWDNKAQAHLWLGNTGHGITADYRGGLVFRTQAAYLFNDGKVGIGTGEEYLPEEKLDVVGTVKMTGLRLQNKDAQTGHVLICSGINGEAIWKDPLGFSVWSVNERNEAYRMSYVGIGTDEPQEMLDVAGNILVNDAIIGKIPANKEKYYDPDFFTLKGSVNIKSSRIMLPKGNNPDHNPIKILNPDIDGGIQFMNEGVMKMDIRRDEVVFGKPDHKLQVKVNGKVWANEVEVQLTGWPDYVFDDNYKLMPLHQLESFIEANNHLPDIPTEKDVLENGIELGEMNALLLKKVEELTLYVIELKKEVGAMKKQQGSQTSNK